MTNHNGPPPERDRFDSIVAGLDLTEPTPLDLYFLSLDGLEAVIAKDLQRSGQKFSPEGIIEVDEALFDASARFSEVVSEVSGQKERLETAADLLHESLARLRALHSRVTGEMDLSGIDDLDETQTVLRDRVADFQGRGDMEPYKHAYYAVLKDEITVFPLGHTWEH